MNQKIRRWIRDLKTLKNEIPEITGKLFGIPTKKIENLFPKLDSLRQDAASQVYNSNLNMNDMLIKDKNTQRALKDLYERDKRGRKPTGRGYVAKKIKKDEEYTGPGKYKKGGSVKAKCKLGRNKPTKLY